MSHDEGQAGRGDGRGRAPLEHVEPPEETLAEDEAPTPAWLPLVGLGLGLAGLLGWLLVPAASSPTQAAAAPSAEAAGEVEGEQASPPEATRPGHGGPPPGREFDRRPQPPVGAQGDLEPARPGAGMPSSTPPSAPPRTGR